MVNLMTTINKDLVPFNVIFGVIIFLFTFLFIISGTQISDDKDFKSVPFGIAEVFQGYRNAIGDINMPSFDLWEGDKYHIIMVCWILLIFLGSSYLQIIVMLNFLIAKISQAYDDVMGKEQILLIQNLVDLNVESAILIDRLNIIKGAVQKHAQSFYIQSQKADGDQDQYSGLLKSVKMFISKSYLKLDIKVEEVNRNFERQIA